MSRPEYQGGVLVAASTPRPNADGIAPLPGLQALAERQRRHGRSRPDRQSGGGVDPAALGCAAGCERAMGIRTAGPCWPEAEVAALCRANATALISSCSLARSPIQRR
ncbi:MAG TPA: hypothetical protein VHX39_23150, partial [Acetobacteraceae bacterium]|nr:hypothetical protein [Acetobacteraceae bacterium]